MKYLSLALLVLVSCGKNAEGLKAPNQLAPISGSFNLLTTEEVDPQMRDASILVYPNDEDFEGYSNTLPQATYDALFTGNFKKIPRSIPKHLNNYEKKRLFVMEVMGIGAARDRYYVQMNKNDVKIEKIKADLTEQYFEKFPCYQFKAGENKNKCTLYKSDETRTSPKVQKRCTRFESYLDRFVVISDDDKAAYEQAITNCYADNNELEKLVDENNQLDQDRTLGRDAAFQLLETVQDRRGLKFYASVTAADSKLELVQSSPGHYEVKSLEMKMFNGIDTSVYSIAGGEIVIKKFTQRADGHKVLELRIDLGEFVINTDLWFASHGEFDLRLVSKDLVATYPDGSKREGVMKIEMDFVK